MSRNTPHRVLGVPDYATSDEIKHAYRAQVLRWHPDRHTTDRATASKRFAEINQAYKALTCSMDLESDFEEPIVMGLDKKGQSSTLQRTTSRSSSVSSYVSTDSLKDSDDRDSLSPTTPSSSFKESPTTSAWPKQLFTSSPYRPEHKATPTYESWRAGSDLPEAFRDKVYVPSHPSHSKPTVPKAPRRPPTPAHPNRPHGPHHDPSSPSHPPIQRPALSVVVPQHVSNSRHSGSERHYVNVYGEVATQPIHAAPYDLPLVSIGLGPTGEWTYSLPLTLEELFSGVHLKFPIQRRLLSGRSRTVTLDLEIPSGCPPSSRLFCRRVGHEIKPGLLQDIAFIIEEKPHPRFARLELRSDLVIDVHVPWTEPMRQYGTEASFTGIDGAPLSVFIDYPRNKATQGRSVIKGAGMPVRHAGKVVGRGDLIVQWEIVSMAEQPKIMHFVKRLWKK